MEPISTIGAAVEVGLKLTDLGRKLHDAIDGAKGTRIEMRVLLYLQVAQRAIRALGRERQEILADAAGCAVEERAQVDAVLERMRTYLQKDNIREPLKAAIQGLRGCQTEFEHAASGIKWRQRDKRKAIQAFLATLGDLEIQVQSLEHDFYPEFSGQGLGTLVPVYELLNRILSDLRRGRAVDLDAEDEQMVELVRAALRDPAQRNWIDKTAHIEQLIVELQLAFSMKGAAG